MELPVVVLLLTAGAAYPQAVDQVKIENEHPRLFLNARRLKLLRRERERQSLRWQQFDLLISGGARMAEPGFSQGLYYQISGDENSGRKAVEWATGPNITDLRQMALVFDWCQPLLSSSQSALLAGKLARGMAEAARSAGIPTIRNGVLAAIALADHVRPGPEKHLETVVGQWWLGRLAPALNDGSGHIPRRDVFALMEILHSVRDNLNIDLREAAPRFFKDMPAYHLLSHYPAPYPAAENEYRIPVYEGKGEPDLNDAALSRAAELSMVAFDTNALESQYLQGWLIRDRFLMRGAFGSPYEFLWANPYQPGLSYYHMPLWFHDARAGRLLARSSWEDDAAWFGRLDGLTQYFSEGKISTIVPQSQTGPLQVGEAAILFPKQGSRFQVAAESAQAVFVVGLRPGEVYDVEIDDEEIREEQTDPGGILALDLAPGTKAAVRLSPSRRPLVGRRESH